ncbi:bifunctional adenosylcobinamide kinase/adenosylcobinamide-phosphate guanylyltransferase [Anaerocolumna xylanovorans]|uniref:Adenosylcobinamide kinase n=1 Tax=Anaerocolumna xylanovorans DSM 12503 TaxID=1121345 RepID=A0A1M7XYR3_9FIRM|nr:bifunctional adenosylcobinamide kinase/adenosylcobinamide-phosphate guanylyltransferase [Anaerocolumna xylanovorans]SHO44177.1 adenosylcobinamide kinase /adenosylcobinamide-phosphate guanylyltransferase [Anaerocolumna xylanovorans DSM 12503]
MMVLITGGSGSGKSAYAEKASVTLAGEGTLYYLATMQVYDEEGRKKIERHQRLRAGKGFQTIEQPVNITEVAAKMEDSRKTVLLECMSNLTANEMFSFSEIKQPDEVVEKIYKGIGLLKEKTDHLLIVTNNVFEDGITYDTATTDYLQALGKINEKLAEFADVVTEVVVGIPVPVKGCPVA